MRKPDYEGMAIDCLNGLPLDMEDFLVAKKRLTEAFQELYKRGKLETGIKIRNAIVKVLY